MNIFKELVDMIKGEEKSRKICLRCMGLKPHKYKEFTEDFSKRLPPDFECELDEKGNLEIRRKSVQ